MKSTKKVKPKVKPKPKKSADPALTAEARRRGVSEDQVFRETVEEGLDRKPRRKRPTAQQQRIELAADLSRVQSRASVAERARAAVEKALHKQFLRARNTVLKATSRLLDDPDDKKSQRKAEIAWRDYGTVYRITRAALGEDQVIELVRKNLARALDRANDAIDDEDERAGRSDDE